jgi:hypothetical protein
MTGHSSQWQYARNTATKITRYKTPPSVPMVSLGSQGKQWQTAYHSP